MPGSREYGVLLLGASGYTGKLCARHITFHLPTDLRWAVAGRNAAKLKALVGELRDLNRDRRQPDIQAVQLTSIELDALAKKTKVLLNTIGPYHLYSTPVVEACATNGTHYLDVTGEVPWVREILQKFHRVAKSNKAILIPEIGIEAAPLDLVAYTAASTIRDVYHCGVRDVVCAVHELKAAGLSGGTLTTALSLFDEYSVAEIRASLDPFALSSTPSQKRSSFRGLFSQIFGPFSHPDLGQLTTAMTASINEPVVHRSSSLMPNFCGPNFRFGQYLRVRNYAWRVLVHLGLAFASILLTLSPVRALIKRFIYQPGQGPSVEASAKDVLEYRAVAIADQPGPTKKAMATFRYEGSIYYLTGVFLAEAAMVLLKEKDLVEELGGRVLTPACLGDRFVERLQGANVRIDGKLLDA